MPCACTLADALACRPPLNCWGIRSVPFETFMATDILSQDLSFMAACAAHVDSRDPESGCTWIRSWQRRLRLRNELIAPAKWCMCDENIAALYHDWSRITGIALTAHSISIASRFLAIAVLFR